MRSVPRSVSSFVSSALAALAALALPPAACALELLDGRVQIHGYVEEQLRVLSDGYHADRFHWSQWAHVLDLETEVDLAPKGWGPFTLASGFVRFEVRYDCIWSKMCGLAKSADFFGDRAYRAPKNLTTGRSSGFTGAIPNPDSVSLKAHNDAGELLPFTSVPPLDTITALGGTSISRTFAPVLDARFALRDYGGTLGPGSLPLGPWLPRNVIHPSGVLQDVTNTTTALPFRPTIGSTPPYSGGAHGLYSPSFALRSEMGGFDSFDQNFTENQLRWNHGGGQDDGELKELYVDFEMLEGTLYFRAGKQAIVWGKTELFRTTDQFNPQDLGLASLPSFEESRLALWSVKGVYSFYDVGPLEDVRLEAAVNLDDFEPVDIGRCGEPYAAFLVCGKSIGLFAHGVLGAGLAGEDRPPNPWDSVKGLEFGARLEWRWDRFSFALSDFWGYNDFPVARVLNAYERRVDPSTGRPMDVTGRVLLGTDADITQRARDFNSTNRQFYDVFCSATAGIASRAVAIPGVDLSNVCSLDIFNSQVAVLPGTTIALALGMTMGGELGGEIVLLSVLSAIGATIPPDLPIPGILQDLNRNGSEISSNGLTGLLSDQQEALLACGPFYGTSCTNDGIDLMNAEASVLLQAFPMVEGGGITGTTVVNGVTLPRALVAGGPVATRFVNGRVVTLPGARTPLLADGSANPDYDPLIDGCISPSFGGATCATATDYWAQGYSNELALVSENLMKLLTVLGASTRAPDGSLQDPNCSLSAPENCALVRAIFGAAGTQRPELRAGGNGRFGRRDFFWASGAELMITYNKRNVLGFAMDFAEDRTKTTWHVEMTWVSEEAFANAKSPKGYAQSPVYNLTVSVDRPTFIKFVNPNRTFFFNSQWFFRYIQEYQRGGAFSVSGPFDVLATFTAVTGYFQDRLLPALTLVHDIPSASGAVLFQTTYRFSEAFSGTIGLATFYGQPERQMIPMTQAVIGNNGGSFDTRTRFDGLSVIAERDEFFLTLRYTF